MNLVVSMALEAVEHRDRWTLELQRTGGHGFLEFAAQYVLQPRADGSTHLSYEVTLVPCPIFPLPLVERKIRKEVPKLLAAVSHRLGRSVRPRVSCHCGLGILSMWCGCPDTSTADPACSHSSSHLYPQLTRLRGGRRRRQLVSAPTGQPHPCPAPVADVASACPPNHDENHDWR